MIMESFHGFSHKYDYSIVGHDGGSPLIPFVEFGKPPITREQRLNVIKMMYWNAMFCVSGDHTLAAAELAVKEVVKEEGDDYFVFVLSDANLSAYGITSTTLKAVLFTDPRVHSYAIFIAGAGTAQSLLKDLPLGHGFLCMDTAKLPTTFKEIFSSSLLRVSSRL